METFFACIDDSGNYQRERSANFTRRYPYYVKACVLIPAKHWKNLCAFQSLLLHRHTRQRLKELKWSHLWKLRRRDLDKKPTKFGPNEAHLERIRYEEAQRYATDFLSVLPECEARVTCTITPNIVFPELLKPRQRASRNSRLKTRKHCVQSFANTKRRSRPVECGDAPPKHGKFTLSPRQEPLQVVNHLG